MKTLIPIHKSFSVVSDLDGVFYLVHTGCDYRWMEHFPYCIKGYFFLSSEGEETGRYTKAYNCGNCRCSRATKDKFIFVARSMS